jgi:hypothetical protein
VISPEAAVVAARRELEQVDMRDNPNMAAVRASGDVGLPVLVERLDKPGQSYYLIPWHDPRGVMLIVQVDAQSGLMSSMAFAKAPLKRLTISDNEAQSIVSERLGVRSVGRPTLVWSPCRESASPFQPFYQVPIEGGQAFVDMLGTLHEHLTPFGKGG